MTHDLPELPEPAVAYGNYAGSPGEGASDNYWSEEQMSAYATAHAASLEVEVARLLKALDGAYALSIGWAAHYQHSHSLQAIHPMHQEILDECKALLSKRWSALEAEGS